MSHIPAINMNKTSASNQDPSSALGSKKWLPTSNLWTPTTWSPRGKKATAPTAPVTNTAGSTMAQKEQILRAMYATLTSTLPLCTRTPTLGKCQTMNGWAITTFKTEPMLLRVAINPQYWKSMVWELVGTTCHQESLYWSISKMRHWMLATAVSWYGR